ncbi:AfsR/SARP family transcriptional regulator [Streptomyces sp. LaPpAH-108]|uniref:AfsR/SARP family transcriptional regulator n=1 Tax=Streptomyces sp. LaPpAH-108 TaxID=1155714 RepID=UPI00056B4E83|nr:BTAD domain-containing putative transcriptional regulator [Streptomyces sp. LaPpAH-108]
MNTANWNALRFSVLGPVRAWCGDRELGLGSPQQRVVLAALLLRRKRAVTLAELVDAVWGLEPPTAAVSVLRTYVSRLRKVLEPDRDPADPPRTIVSVGDGYTIRIPETALDLAEFERRVRDAAEAAASGDESAAADLLHEALDGWQGMALAGLPGPLAEAERSRLAEERLNALERRLDLDVRLGRHGQAIAELMALTDEHPLREELCRLLMLALYRSGRQAEALAAYRGTRTTLVSELGVEPGAALRDLHTRILATDRSLDLRPRHRTEEAAAPGTTTAMTGTAASTSGAARSDAAPEPAVRADPPRIAQLPGELAVFTGRNAELEWARGLFPLDGGALPTLVISAISGMAGVGKTTLAVHLAHRVAEHFPDGQLFVNLRGFDPTGSVMPPQEAIRILLDALGVPPQQLPSGLEAQTALYRSMLAKRRVLILLDNARDSEQVRPLLPGCPGCLVIVTSRNQLTGLVVGEGAQPLTLSQLTPAEAHEFLARRLGADRLAEDPAAVDEIVARCALLPLALAVVAARAATHPGFPLGAIADELRDSPENLDAFAGDDVTIDVRTVFASSYELLSAPAARLFRLLGLHRGPDLSAPATAALAGLPPRETRGLLAELTRAHLLTEHFPGRYTLHDLLRVYATERAHAEETPQERDLAVERLLSWYLHTADATHPHITPDRHRIALAPPPPSCKPLTFTTHDQAVNWCETERANLVAAVHQAAESGKSTIAWRLPAALWGFFHLRGHLDDWYGAARTGLSAARAAHDRPGEAQALMDTASALRCANRYDEAIDHYLRAMTVFRELGDVRGRLRAVGNLGDAYLHAGQFAKAAVYSRRGLALGRAVGSSWGEGLSLSNLGDAYQRLGRFDDAVACLEQALTVLRAGGNRWVEGVTLDVLGTVHHRLGAHDRAVEYYTRALTTHRDIGNRWGEGHTLGHLGDVQLASGDPEAADGSWRQALAIFAESGHPDAAKIEGKLRSLQPASR